MSALITQAKLNNASYEDLDKLLWMITYTSKVKNVDWGEEMSKMKDYQQHAGVVEQEWKAEWDDMDLEAVRECLQKPFIPKKAKAAKKDEEPKDAHDDGDDAKKKGGKKAREEDPDNIDTWKVGTLKAEAKKRKVPGYTKMDRAGLVEALKKDDEKPEEAEAEPDAEEPSHAEAYDKMKVGELRDLCKEREIKSTTGKNKEWLIQQLRDYDASRAAGTEDEPEPEEPEEPAKKKKVRSNQKPKKPKPTDEDEDEEKPSPMDWAEMMEEKAAQGQDDEEEE